MFYIKHTRNHKIYKNILNVCVLDKKINDYFILNHTFCELQV